MLLSVIGLMTQPVMGSIPSYQITTPLPFNQNCFYGEVRDNEMTLKVINWYVSPTYSVFDIYPKFPETILNCVGDAKFNFHHVNIKIIQGDNTCVKQVWNFDGSTQCTRSIDMNSKDPISLYMDIDYYRQNTGEHRTFKLNQGYDWDISQRYKVYP